MTALAASLQAFFTQRLIQQRRASPHTIAAYRDTLRMLLIFTSPGAGKRVSNLDIADLDASTIAAFLDPCNTNEVTASAPATPASPRSTPCSATSPWLTPNTPRASDACWPSPQNAATTPSSRS